MKLFKKKERKLMSIYKDKNGNLYGGTIHKDNGKSYVDIVSHIQEPEYLGKFKF
jgi:hypothetical protein